MSDTQTREPYPSDSLAKCPDCGEEDYLVRLDPCYEIHHLRVNEDGANVAVFDSTTDSHDYGYIECQNCASQWSCESLEMQPE